MICPDFDCINAVIWSVLSVKLALHVQSRELRRCPAARWPVHALQSQFKPIFPANLKSDQSVLYTILFVFERASHWYLYHLNWSSMGKAIDIIQKSRIAIKVLNLGGYSRKERNYYLVKPNLFLNQWSTKFPTWMTLFTKFKSFSSVYIPHNLIHNIHIFIASKIGEPPRLLLHSSNPISSIHHSIHRSWILEQGKRGLKIAQKIIIGFCLFFLYVL